MRMRRSSRGDSAEQLTEREIKMRCCLAESAQPLPTVRDQRVGYLLRLTGHLVQELRQTNHRLKQEGGLQLRQLLDGDSIRYRAKRSRSVAP